MRDFRKYDVYHDAIEFAISIYKTTGSFPDAEKFNLVSQLQRAAVSISANVAEGAGRSTSKDLARFISQSLGSANECETLLVIASRLNLVADLELNHLIEDLQSIQKRLAGLRKTLLSSNTSNKYH